MLATVAPLATASSATSPRGIRAGWTARAPASREASAESCSGTAVVWSSVGILRASGSTCGPTIRLGANVAGLQRFSWRYAASVAWNTEQTKRRLKDAATEEFAAHGLHGTTVDRIAERAGVNKERLYNYFGDKRSLFATVL